MNTLVGLLPKESTHGPSCHDHINVFIQFIACEVVGDYVELAHHFSHYYSRKYRRMMSKVTGVINSSFISEAQVM